MSLCLCAAFWHSTLAAQASGSPAGISDLEVLKGVKLVDDGDYDGAILTLDNAARRLSADPAKARDLSQAYLYLGIAYVGKGQEAAAKARFRDALAQIKDLTLSPEKFPSKVINVFEAARDEIAKAPAPTATPASKGGSHKGLLIGAGVAVAAGVGIAAASGGKSSPASPPPPTLKTDTFGPITLSVADYCEPSPFTFFVNTSGTLTAKLAWQESYATLQMALFDNPTAASNGMPVVAQSSQTSNTTATMTAPVAPVSASAPKEYILGVCHIGNSCTGPGSPSPCSAIFTLTVAGPFS